MFIDIKNRDLTPSRRFQTQSRWFISVLAAGFLLAGCAPAKPRELSPGHLDNLGQDPTGIPPALTQVPVLPVPKPEPKLETYTVVVADVPVRDLLFSLARDASINVDISTEITGKVTLNAVDQTLPQILERITNQVSLRYAFDGPNLIISPDSPFWRIYRVDYVNMSRESTSEVRVATQIATTGGGVGGVGGGSAGGGEGNLSNTTVKNVSSNNFWGVLESNIKAIIGASGEESAAASGDMATPAAPGTMPITIPVVTNPAAGLINVHASQKQHAQVQAFVDRVMANAQRQVLIEMTIVEVELNDGFQSGVDWSRLSDNNGTGGNGPSLTANLIGTTNLSTAPVFTLGYQNSDSALGNINATVKLLESFGTVRVLSSPKIMALNNQTALLKVVDETVYFTVEQETIQAENQPAIITFSSEVNTVPVGMVMSVTPQINENDIVTLSIRPTISRITSFKEDPVPKLVGANFENLIPQIQVREMESLLQVGSGQTIVMGGLMQDKITENRDGIPGLQRAPVIGNLFSYRNDLVTKTELVIFLRPKVIKNSDMQQEWKKYEHLMPSASWAD